MTNQVTNASKFETTVRSQAPVNIAEQAQLVHWSLVNGGATPLNLLLPMLVTKLVTNVRSQVSPSFGRREGDSPPATPSYGCKQPRLLAFGSVTGPFRPCGASPRALRAINGPSMPRRGLGEA